MPSSSRSFVAPLYLFACLVLGGSAQGIWQNMVLQLAGVAIIAWAALDRAGEPLTRSAKQLLMLAILTLGIVALQLIPLPPEVWVHLGPRQRVAEGFHALDISVPWEPLSLTPAAGLNSILAMIPSLALFTAMVRLRAYRRTWVAIALIAGTLAGIALGVLQVTSPTPLASPFYLYEQTNWGRAVGFFANADHMATLLVVTIPFVAALVGVAKTAHMQRYAATIATAAGLGMVVVVGLALNGSLAGYGLALPVIVASVLIILAPRSRLRLWIIGSAALLLIASVTAIEMSSIGSGRIGAHASSAVQSRSNILATTSRAARDFMPFGSGLGSFQRVYPLYERPDQVTTEYVVHAHNDYAEVAVELGIAGVVLMMLLIVWWIRAAWAAWQSAEMGPLARAASIASAAVLVHSLVDFPLRTAAISACFAICLGLLAGGRAAPRFAGDERRPARHVVIGSAT